MNVQTSFQGNVLIAMVCLSLSMNEAGVTTRRLLCLKLFGWFFLFLSIGNMQAQSPKIDSLKVELENHKTRDIVRVDLLHHLVDGYLENDSAIAEGYLAESERLADSLDYTKGKAKNFYLRGLLEAYESNYERGFSNYTKALELYEHIAWNQGIAACYKNMGIYMYYNGDQNEAVAYFKRSLEIFETINNKLEIAQVQYEMGWSYIEMDNYNEARSYLFRALKLNEEIGNPSGISSCLNGISVTYSNQGNYPVALDYCNQTLAIAKKHSNTRRILSTLGNMGNIYVALKKYDKAIELFEEILTLSGSANKGITSKTLSNIGLAYKEKNNLELAYEYLEKSQKLYKEVNDQRGESFALNNIGYIYLETKNYTKAYEYYEQSRKISLEIQNQKGLCISYWGLAKVNANQHDYNKALTNALKSKKLAEDHGLLLYQSMAQELLFEIYKNTGNYKDALESHQRFKSLNDSLFNKENVEKVAQLEYEYKYKQALDSASIRELELTKTVMTTSQDLARSRQNYLWAVIGILLVSILLGSMVFYQKFHTIKIKNQNIVTEQKLLRSQMTPHFIFNSLSVLQGMILNKEEKKSVSYLSRFSRLLRITLENSRDKMVLLSQEIRALENYLELHNLESDAYNYTVEIDEALDTSLFEIPPMLIQPFIENAIEHAFTDLEGDRELATHIKYVNGALICTITDNGIGIDSHKENKGNGKKSLATAITSERLKILSKDFKMNGSVTIEDRARYHERGTVVTLVIPYKKLEAA